MHVEEDLENISMVSNSCYNTVRVITASERTTFQETNRACLSNLSCKQVQNAHSILHIHKTYKLVDDQFINGIKSYVFIELLLCIN